MIVWWIAFNGILKLFRVILCVNIEELPSLYIYIYNFFTHKWDPNRYYHSKLE